MSRIRRGSSLVETMVVIAITGTLMSAVGVCLHGMHRAGQRTREAVERLDTISRLSLRFRQDAHEALSVTDKQVDDDRCLIFLLSEGKSIRYQVRPTVVERTVWQADKLVHRDGFRLPRAVTASWSIATQDVTIVAMEIGRPTNGAEESALPPDRIEAAVRGVILLSEPNKEPVADARET